MYPTAGELRVGSSLSYRMKSTLRLSRIVRLFLLLRRRLGKAFVRLYRKVYRRRRDAFRHGTGLRSLEPRDEEGRQLTAVAPAYDAAVVADVDDDGGDSNGNTKRQNDNGESCTTEMDMTSKCLLSVDSGSSKSVGRSWRNKTRYDVFISHSKENCHLALQLLYMMEQDFSCILEERDFLPGSCYSDEVISAVTSSRRVVLLLSREFMRTNWCMFALLMSLCEMYESGSAVIVPVLVDLTQEEVPPCLRNMTLVDMRHDPNYKEKLMSILKRREVRLEELLPAGNVSPGLAMSYHLRYLKLILPELEQRINRWCEEKRKTTRKYVDVRMPRKLYCLVPASCFCPRSLSEADPRIEYGGDLDPLIITIGGCKDRVYKQTVWNIRQDNGKVLQFVGEYCSVIDLLYKMENQGNAGLDTQQRQQQRDEFLDILKKHLVTDGVHNLIDFVFFHDTDGEGNKTSLSQILAQRIERHRLPLHS